MDQPRRGVTAAIVGVAACLICWPTPSPTAQVDHLAVELQLTRQEKQRRRQLERLQAMIFVQQERERIAQLRKDVKARVKKITEEILEELRQQRSK